MMYYTLLKRTLCVLLLTFPITSHALDHPHKHKVHVVYNVSKHKLQKKKSVDIAYKTKSIRTVGIASWYGSKFHGRKTASGERFDQLKLTAAHRTIPMNSLVRVTNLENNKSVIVKINDRGPYVKNRVIDLSKKAASVIKLDGIGLVNLTVIRVDKS